MQSSRKFDVVVLGGGIVGAATTDRLARKGKRVLMVDQFKPGHDRGSSHGEGRIIRVAYPEPIYLEMAKLAYAGWDELSERNGEALVQKTGGWDCAPIGSPQLADLVENYNHFDVSFERLSAAESNERLPYFHLEEGSEAIYQPDYGIVYATRAVKALWSLAETAGATTIAGEKVVEVVRQNQQYRLQSASGSVWTAPRLVIAAGAWVGKIMRDFYIDLPLSVSQEQYAFFPVKDGVSHRVGHMPVMVDYHHEYVFYALPQIDVPGVKVGWHHTGQPIDPDYPQPISERNLVRVQEFVAKRFPHLDSSNPFAVTRCLYTNTPDHHFILDRHPDLPTMAIGAGFSGHGFKFGPVLGQILAALVLDEKPPVDLDQFSISRLAEPDKLQRRRGA